MTVILGHLNGQVSEFQIKVLLDLYLAMVGLIESFANQMRRSIFNEFSEIYIINLRVIRKYMLLKGNNDEGENIFDSGSMSGIAISILVKRKGKKCDSIKYIDIGKNKTAKSKLSTLSYYKDVFGFIKTGKYSLISPNSEGDWLNQGNKKFKTFIPIGSKEIEEKIFRINSLGLVTNRDAWCINFSQKNLSENIKYLIDNYNNTLLNLPKIIPDIKNIVPRDPKKYVGQGNY